MALHASQQLLVRAVKKEEVQFDQFLPQNTEDTQIKRMYRVPGRLIPALKEELELLKSLKGHRVKGAVQ